MGIAFAVFLWRLVLLPFHHVALSVVALGVALEAVLAGRAFIQLTYEPQINGTAETILDKTDGLVAPFRALEGTTPLRETGVVEFATLATMEAVLIGVVVIVLALTFWSEMLHLVRRILAYFERRGEREAADEEPVATSETPPASEPELTAAS